MFEHNKNKVTIEFIANGVLVILPIRNITTEEYDKSIAIREAQIHAIYNQELESDSEVRRLQGKLEFEDIPDDKKYRKMTLSEIRDQQIYQFQTLPLALEFISQEFKN